MKVFIGYDEREAEAFHTCAKSIYDNFDHNRSKLEIKPIVLEELVAKKLYWREDDPLASTKFTYSRFWTPYLCDYEDWAMFVDCDFVFTADLNELFKQARERYRVLVCKHDYTPSQDIKMDGVRQTVYPRKNWSSLILFNNENCEILDLEHLNRMPAKWLHRFQWCSDDEIGDLPLDWNFLVGEYEKTERLPRGIHYTNGGPWFDNCKDVDYADIYTFYRDRK